MSSTLAKLLSRGRNGLPSVVTVIDQELTKVSKVTYSHRRVVNTLKALTKLVEQCADEEIIRRALNAFLQAVEAPKSRKDHYIHPSELLGGCQRAIYYRLLEVPETNKPVPHAATTQRTFDVGTFYHRYLQDLLRSAGILEGAEVTVFNKDLRLIGHADGIIIVAGKRLLLEIKTCNSRYYAQIVKANKPLDSHLYQASVYAQELEIPQICFIYVNKDTSEMIELIVDEKDYTMFQDEAYEKIDYINDCVDNNIEPPRICRTATDKPALRCVHCNHCFNL